VRPELAHLQAAGEAAWRLRQRIISCGRCNVFCERDEERYLTLIWPKTVVIHDMDDTREAAYGVFYTKSKPLSLAVRKK
jgi:hypothetical protein